jgi:hypothetical protein
VSVTACSSRKRWRSKAGARHRHTCHTVPTRRGRRHHRTGAAFRRGSWRRHRVWGGGDQRVFLGTRAVHPVQFSTTAPLAEYVRDCYFRSLNGRNTVAAWLWHGFADRRAGGARPRRAVCRPAPRPCPGPRPHCVPPRRI